MVTPNSEEHEENQSPDATAEHPEAADANSEQAEPEIVRLHAVVYGVVQGVGFRANTQRAASQAGITGWVRNQWDGTVEVVAEGPRVILERFEQFLHQGPRAAHVERVELSYEAATGEFSRFSVRY
ncbi:MAG: acylphosphatase [Anaerolineae bacterium]|nr:acylphosphatase [Anaerolineae bacterium]